MRIRPQPNNSFGINISCNEIRKIIDQHNQLVIIPLIQFIFSKKVNMLAVVQAFFQVISPDARQIGYVPLFSGQAK
ncbi:MAG: hypothetical protein IT259_20590 [Saprospiraceae bacterium]|nr:hypothetical protein [Saprospiraceae bacterium]